MTVARVAALSPWQGGQYNTPGVEAPPAAWAPDDTANWLAMMAAIDVLGVPAVVLSEEQGGLKATASGSGSVATDGLVGFVPNHRDLDIGATSSADRRPTYATVGGLPAIRFDGPIYAGELTGEETSDELLFAPALHAAATTGHLGMTVYPLSAALDNQTVLQLWSLRIMQIDVAGEAKLAVRVGGSEHLVLNGNAAFETWAFIEIKWSGSTVSIRRGGYPWQDFTGKSLMSNADSRIGRNSYAPFDGAPAVMGFRRLWLVNGAQLSDSAAAGARAWAMEGTGITDYELGGTISPSPPGLMATPARTVNVSNGTQLDAAIADLRPGDRVVLADGTYAGNKTIGANGTAATNGQIEFVAANAHLAIVTGTWTINGDWITVWQLRKTGTSNGFTVNGDDCRVLRTQTYGTGAAAIEVNEPAARAEIAYNLIENFGTGVSSGRGISVDCNGSNHPTAPHIHHNFLKNQVSTNGGGIILGSSHTHTENEIEGLIEYNLIDGFNGIEPLSAKSSANIFQFNTVKNANGVIMCRHGRGNQYLGNSSFNSGGVMLFGEGNVAMGNYHDGTLTGSWRSHNAGRGTVEQDDYISSGGGSVYPRARSCRFIGNIGPLTFAGGNSSATLQPIDCEVRAHTGSFSNGAAIGTIGSPSDPVPVGVTVPAYVVLTESDVGPDANATSVAEIFAVPFNKNSAYHRRVGSGLVVADDSYSTDDEWKAMRDAWLAVVPSNNGQTSGGTIGAINQGNPFGTAAVYGTAADPLRTIRWRNCTDSGSGIGVWQPGGTSTERRIPTSNGINATPANQCYENTAWIMNEGSFEALELFQANNRGGGDYTGSIGRLLDAKGLGHPSSLGERIGVSASGCSVRMGLLDSAKLLALEPIRHALKLAVYSGYTGEAYALLGRKIQWPAGNADSFAGNPSFNTGPFRYGTLMVIPAAVDLEGFGITTDEGMLIAECLQDYGGYIMDDANGIVIRATGSLGVNAAAIVADFRKCLRQLRPAVGSVTNSTASIAADGGYTQTGSIGTPNGGDVAGGGTPRDINTAYDA